LVDDDDEYMVDDDDELYVIDISQSTEVEVWTL